MCNSILFFGESDDCGCMHEVWSTLKFDLRYCFHTSKLQYFLPYIDMN